MIAPSFKRPLAGAEAVIQYDLTNTPSARDAQAGRPPSEVELFALTLGLMLDANCGFAELTSRVLILTAENCPRVAQLLEEHTPQLARELGSPRGLRRRLRELVGIRITRCPELFV